MNHAVERDMEPDDQATREQETGHKLSERSIVHGSSLRSLSRPPQQCCMVRVRGNRMCGAPALANGKCRRHGGKNPLDHQFRRLHAEHSAGAPYRPFWGNALDAAIMACRTQQRLLPLVEALTQPSQLYPDQGVLRPGAPASDACMSPT
jgi:hypothetical protein